MWSTRGRSPGNDKDEGHVEEGSIDVPSGNGESPERSLQWKSHSGKDWCDKFYG